MYSYKRCLVGCPTSFPGIVWIDPLILLIFVLPVSTSVLICQNKQREKTFQPFCNKTLNCVWEQLVRSFQWWIVITLLTRTGIFSDQTNAKLTSKQWFLHSSLIFLQWASVHKTSHFKWTHYISMIDEFEVHNSTNIQLLHKIYYKYMPKILMPNFH